MFRRGNFRSTFYNESKKQQQKSSKVKNLRDIPGRVVVQLPLAISFSRLQRAKNGGKDNIFSRSRVIADISAHGFVFGEKPSTFL